MSQTFQRLKQSYTKQRRRQQLQKRFALKRKQLTTQLEQKQKRTFEQILPLINPQNYEQHRSLLSDFARSSQYSYEMLPTVFMVYEYLLKNKGDLPSWEIIVYLSYYEDFQIPQTEVLAHMTVELLQRNAQLGSQFLFNISKISKCSLLCCRLIDLRIIELISQIVHRLENVYWKQSMEHAQFARKQQIQVQIFNLLTFLSHIFTLKPQLQLDQLHMICSILSSQSNLTNNNNKFLKQIHTQTIFRLMQNVIQDHIKQKVIIQLLIQVFQQTLYNSFFVYQQQSIMFINLCVQNKIQLTLRLLQNLFISIKSKSKKSKVAALKLLQRILIPRKQTQKMEVEESCCNDLGNFIQTKTLPTLQQFSSIFSTKNEESTGKSIQSQHANTLMVFSLLFTQKYETQLKLILEIYQNSGQEIQQQIVILIKHILKCLIQEICNYHPTRLVQSKKQVFVPENMEEFLCLTIQQQEFFFFLTQCLKNSNVNIILNALEILEDILLYFRNDEKQLAEINHKVDFNFLVNHCQKFPVYSALETLLNQNNPQIKDLAEDLICLLDQRLDSNHNQKEE